MAYILLFLFVVALATHHFAIAIICVLAALLGPFVVGRRS